MTAPTTAVPADTSEEGDSPIIRIRQYRTRSDLQPVLLSIPLTAEVTSLSEQTIRRLIRRGELDVKQVGDMMRVKYASLLAWVDRDESKARQDRRARKGRKESAA